MSWLRGGVWRGICDWDGGCGICDGVDCGICGCGVCVDVEACDLGCSDSIELINELRMGIVGVVGGLKDCKIEGDESKKYVVPGF